MAYDMQAEVDNGSDRTTFVGAVTWTHDVTLHGHVVFNLDATQQSDLRPQVGLQCIAHLSQ
jgi:hypothetical protein